MLQLISFLFLNLNELMIERALSMNEIDRAAFNRTRFYAIDITKEDRKPGKIRRNEFVGLRYSIPGN